MSKKIAFDKYSKVRHEDSLNKVPKAIEWIIEQLEENESKLVIFAHHKDVISALQNGLSAYGVVTIDGDTPQKDRLGIVDDFQTDPDIQIIICSIKAAGVGLTLTAASWMVFVELDWTPGTMNQAEDRCHRIGQKENLLIHHLIVDGTLDAKMARMLVEKQELADMALDDEATYTNEGKPIAKKRNPIDTGKMWAAQLRLKYLADRCDGAYQQDNMGFNKLDTNIGKSLSRIVTFSEKQLALAEKMLVKYRKQLERGGFTA